MGLPALLILTGLLVYRRWYRTFPFFLIYVVGAESIGLIRLAVSTAAVPVYARTYWFSDTFLAAFAFLASYELFFKLLFPNFYRTRFYRILFPGMAILVSVLASLIAVSRGHSSVLTATVQVYEFIRAALLFFFIALMLAMGRQWSKQEFGIAFGFGLDVAFSLASIGTWSHTSNRSAVLTRLSVIAYDGACLLWLYCFWAAPKVPVTFQQDLPEKLDEARRSEKVLKDFMTSGKPRP